MRNVLDITMEAGLRALFVNCQRGAAMCMAIIDMGHAQPPTPALKDNSTGDVFVNDNIRQRRSRAIDMRFYWFKDRVRKGQFLMYWMNGEHNLADYFTKHHPTIHHQLHRIIYLVPTEDASKYSCYMPPIDL